MNEYEVLGWNQEGLTARRLLRTQDYEEAMRQMEREAAKCEYRCILLRRNGQVSSSILTAKDCRA